MNDRIHTILIMSISGSIVAALLFLIKPFVRNRLPKNIQYYLWLVVVAALLIPVSKLVVFPNNPVSMPVAPIQTVVEQGVLTVTETISEIYPLSPSGSGHPENESISGSINESNIPQPYLDIPVFTIILSIYLSGIVAALLYFIINYALFTKSHRRRNLAASAAETMIFNDLCGSKRIPQLYRNPLAATPMLFGLFRPAIILPDREYTNDQLRSVLLHELTHLRKKDILVKWLSVIACSVHWFNPVVWVVRREIDRACELACDEAVIRRFDAADKQIYGETLLYVASESKIPHAVLSTTMCMEKKALKERLSAILKSKKHSRIALIVSVVLLLTFGGVAVALGAGRSAQPAEMRIIYIDNPAQWGKDMKLVWGDTVYHEAHITGAAPGREIGYAADEYSNWRIYELKGYSRNYLYAKEEDNDDVWRVMSIFPPEQPLHLYILFDVSDTDYFIKTTSISLYKDGTALLATPPISSYALVTPLYYEFTDNGLSLFYEKDEPIARFAEINLGVIKFMSSTVPLYIDEGAIYIKTYIAEPNIMIPTTGFDRIVPGNDPQNMIPPVGSAAVPTEYGVTMKISDISPSGLSFYFENPTDNEYMYGAAFYVFVLKNDEWERVEPIITNWGFTLEGYYLLPNSTTKPTGAFWQWLYGELPEGDYKFQKEIIFIHSPGDNERFVLEHRFVLP